MRGEFEIGVFLVAGGAGPGGGVVDFGEAVRAGLMHGCWDIFI